MATHFHWSAENIVFYAATTAVVWHLIRLLAAKLGGNVGTAVGGFFTFGG
ncbi:MAG: hypothetical protein KGJ45_11860 [Elusimicrobia bacterium]|nr:hypothetical protein [Elusimicrobiota bacterium]